MNPKNAQWFILVIINLPVYLALGRLIFGGWGTAKLPVFIVLCIALPVVEHLMFGKTNVVRPAAQVVGLL